MLFQGISIFQDLTPDEEDLSPEGPPVNKYFVIFFP